MIKKSPWLGGSLFTDKKKFGKKTPVGIKWDAAVEEGKIKQMFEVDEQLAFTEDMPYKDVGKAIAKSTAHVKRGTQL
jgi:hypothetical protein